MIGFNNFKNTFFRGRWIITSVILVALFAFLMLGSVGSAGPLHVVNVPKFEVDMVVAHWGAESYFDTTISGIGGPEEGYSVWDGTWVGWCVDESHYIYPGTTYPITLNSTYDSLMLWPDDDWDMVNYLINHKDPSADRVQIQKAIWYFINGGYTGIDSVILGMITEAGTNGDGFVPQEGQMCAVLCTTDEGIQRTFIEVPVPATPCVVYVDDDYNHLTSGWGFDHFDNIQDGIDAVCDGGTVIVYDGTYDTFKVEGRNDITITKGSLPVISGNQLVYDITYPGFVNNVVFVNNSQNINLIGFEIQGTNPGGRDYTVLYQNSSGMIKDCIVSPGNRGNMYALAVRAHVNSTLTIESCTIQDYGRIGIYCRQGTTMYIYNNTLIGQTYSTADGDYVNYGIEIEDLSYKSHAVIRGNEIYGHDYTDNPSWSSAGIIVDAWRYYMVTDENCSAIIEQNDIHDNYFGIEIVPNDDIHINCNNIYDNRWYGAISSPYYDGMQYVNYTLDANCNWWGDCSGPYNDTLNPYGQGDQVDDYVDFDPWVGKITVDAGGPYYNEDEPYTIHFDGSYNTPGCCGEVVTIEWVFGDGETSDEIDPTHNYPDENGYTATLTITTETTIGSQTHICSDSDTAIVNVRDDPPIVQLEYPRGGEELSGTVTIKWFAIDSEDWGSPDIWLYYSADGGDSWVEIARNLVNTIGDGAYKDRGKYSWNTGSLPDGNCKVRIHAYDDAGNRATDYSKPFTIGTRTTGLTVSYVTVGNSNTYIKDGDSLEISAGITYGRHISADYVTADLSGLGYDENEPATSFDGLTAIWELTDVVCTPSDGPITIIVTATDGGSTDSNTATIIADNTIPELNVITPDNALYFRDKKLFSLNKPIIIGALTLEVTADDSSSGIQKTEIYIDDELKETLTGGSEWYMNLRLMGRHTLKIVAYDNAGNINEYSQTVIIINPFGEK